jgi:LysM repeat protein
MSEERRQYNGPQPHDLAGNSGIVSEYVIEEKDTLPDLAKRFGLSIEEIMAANKEVIQTEADLVRPGQRINIPNKIRD